MNIEHIRTCVTAYRSFCPFSPFKDLPSRIQTQRKAAFNPLLQSTMDNMILISRSALGKFTGNASMIA